MPQGQELMQEIRQATVEPGKFALWWLGQQGWIIKTVRCLAGIDLFLSDNPKRRYPALLSPKELAGFDLILGTHDHKDHIDRDAWKIIAKHSLDTMFILPRRSVAEVRIATGIPIDRLMGLDDGQSVVSCDLKVTAVPSAHEWIDNLPEAGGHRWLGYILDPGTGGVLYHAGDTCIWEGMSERLTEWDIRAACLPINGRDAERYKRGVVGCMQYQEAGDLAARIGAKTVLPGHWDAFLRDQTDPNLFAEYVKSRYPEIKAIPPERGARIDL